MSERLGAEHYGEERAEKQQAKAERILAEELNRRKLKACELDAPQGGCGKGSPDHPLANGDDDDGGMDCGPIGHGQPGLFEPTPVSAQEGHGGVAIIKN
ncbi:MAG: hypothetical protein ABSC03_15030 [Verrucomicrobiota bacterium]|jgi:hypothetical protein